MSKALDAQLGVQLAFLQIFIISTDDIPFYNYWIYSTIGLYFLGCICRNFNTCLQYGRISFENHSLPFLYNHDLQEHSFSFCRWCIRIENLLPFTSYQLSTTISHHHSNTSIAPFTMPCNIIVNLHLLSLWNSLSLLIAYIGLLFHWLCANQINSTFIFSNGHFNLSHDHKIFSFVGWGGGGGGLVPPLIIYGITSTLPNLSKDESRPPLILLLVLLF